jgi:hypothetical protein
MNRSMVQNYNYSSTKSGTTKITGKFLYYARAVDPTMLVALSSLASQQTKGTERTAEDAIKFLNYCTTHPESIIWYKKSDMILHCHSDAILPLGITGMCWGFYWEQQTSATPQSTVQF